jgi:hypothetical protein
MWKIEKEKISIRGVEFFIISNSHNSSKIELYLEENAIFIKDYLNTHKLECIPKTDGYSFVSFIIFAKRRNLINYSFDEILTLYKLETGQE